VIVEVFLVNSKKNLLEKGMELTKPFLLCKDMVFIFGKK